jgi:hypothetical protein
MWDRLVNMIEPERMKDGFLLQNPFHTNCLIVALANLLIDAKLLTTVKEISAFERKWTKKYNVNVLGMQPAMVGDIMWGYGMYTSLRLSPATNDFQKDVCDQNTTKKVRFIRVFGFSKETVYDDKYIETRVDGHFWKKRFISKYKNKYYTPTAPRNSIDEHRTTFAHAIFCKDFKSNGDFVGCNLWDNHSKANWYDLGLSPEWKLAKVMGTEMVIAAEPMEMAIKRLIPEPAVPLVDQLS